jgi:hypothetical protein
MIAYKFLRPDRIGPFSAFRWPEPGTWVHAGDETVPCRRGIHACRASDLPWWLAEELWEIELADASEVEEHKLVSRAGRLQRRVNGWDAVAARELAEACAWRAAAKAADALTRAAQPSAAVRLTSTSTIEAMRDTARSLASEIGAARVNLAVAADAAECALSGGAAVSAYIGAHAALRLDGMPAYATEREWQSQWLIERLSLGVTDQASG